MIDLSIVLPVYNEEEIIANVFDDIQKVLDGIHIRYECILVENGSTDRSLDVVTSLAKRYHHARAVTAPKGYGSAVLVGLSFAEGKYVCYMPSDGQVDLSILPTLWSQIQTNRWDMVKVKRIGEKLVVRQITSFVHMLATALFLRTPVIDVNGSPRIFLRKHLGLLRLESRDSFIDTEFAAKVAVLGWRIQEIPMKTLPRAGGISTRNIATYAEFLKNFWRFKKEYRVETWKQHIDGYIY